MEESQAKDESESEEEHPSRSTQRRLRNRWPHLIANSNLPSQAAKTDKEEPKQTWAEELDAETPTDFELLFSSLIADVGSQLLEKQDCTTSQDQELLSSIQLEADAHINQVEKEMWDTQNGVNVVLAKKSRTNSGINLLHENKMES